MKKQKENPQEEEKDEKEKMKSIFKYDWKIGEK